MNAKWPMSILWYPEDGTCPICQAECKFEPAQCLFLGRPIHRGCLEKAQLWSKNPAQLPARFKFLKHRDGSKEPYDTARDPRKDPTPGDVIRGICIGAGRPCSYYVRHVEDGMVHFDFGWKGDPQKASLESWQNWTAGMNAECVEDRVEEKEESKPMSVSGHE